MVNSIPKPWSLWLADKARLEAWKTKQPAKATAPKSKPERLICWLDGYEQLSCPGRKAGRRAPSLRRSCPAANPGRIPGDGNESREAFFRRAPRAACGGPMTLGARPPTYSPLPLTLFAGRRFARQSAENQYRTAGQSFATGSCPRRSRGKFCFGEVEWTWRFLVGLRMMDK